SWKPLLNNLKLRDLNLQPSLLAWSASKDESLPPQPNSHKNTRNLSSIADVRIFASWLRLLAEDRST
ncbi:hypothetical protein KC218_29220, partial [Mycobacterium tuberculosis]|nr:hypothetical protein [Mycobacterium tuberculosis]